MISLRLARTELRRLTSGKLPKLAVFALVLVPLLYGSLYLFANWDPYGRLGNTPAALVVDDRGATTADGRPLHAGQDVATQLEKSNSFQWHRVDEADAEAGVRDGRYTFAMVIPADFSAALNSASTSIARNGSVAPRQGQLTLITNDANNYLVRTIADRIIDQVHRSVASTVGRRAADSMLTGFSTIHDKMADAATGAGKLADGAKQAQDGASRLASGAHALADGQHKLLNGADQLAGGAEQASTGAGQLADGLDTLRDRTSGLPAQTAALASGAQQVAAGNARIAGIGNQVAGTVGQLTAQLDAQKAAIAQGLAKAGIPRSRIDALMLVLNQADSGNQQVQAIAAKLNALSAGANQVAAGAGQLAAAAPQLSGGIQRAAGGAERLRTGTGQLASGAVTLRDGIGTASGGADKLASGADALNAGTGQLADGATRLADGLNSGLGQVPNLDGKARQATAQAIGNPVAVRTAGDVTVGNYGTGLAPFFLGLASWIGAFVLFLLVRPLSKRALAAGQSALRVALGGYLPAALLSVAQMIVLLAVVILAVGVHPANPLATFGFLLLAGLANVAILHALNALLGAVGKFLGLVLLILQLISAGGTFPWQTIPHVLYPLHIVLPMGYVVDGLRHLLYGGPLGSVGVDSLVLAACLVGGLALSVLAAHRRRVWTASTLAPELVL